MRQSSGTSLPRSAWGIPRCIASNWCLLASRCSFLHFGTTNSTATRTGCPKTPFSPSCTLVSNLGVPSSQVRLPHSLFPFTRFNIQLMIALSALQKIGCDPSKVSETGKLAVQLTIAVFTSTVHCQDFKDVEGDRLTGRCTVPIMFPIASRLVVGLGLPIWSYLLCCIWDIDWLCTVAFVAYGCFVGGRFLCFRTRDADKRSCKYYSVSPPWLRLLSRRMY